MIDRFKAVPLILQRKTSTPPEKQRKSKSSKEFRDTERYVRLPMKKKNYIETNKGPRKILNSHIIYVQSTAPNQSDHLIEMFLSLHIFLRYNAQVELVIPYLAHSRQDKEFNLGEVISIDAIGFLLSKLEVHKLITVDVHFDRRIGWFSRFENIQGYNTSAAPAICNYIKNELGINEAVLVIPDEGNKPIINSVKNVWGQNVIYLTKERINERELYIKGSKVDLNNRDVVIIDDMVSTGTTMLKTIEWLKKMGASNFTLGCTHALYLNGAREKLKEAGITNFVSTDTIPNPDAVIKVAPIITKTLKEIMSEKLTVHINAS